MLLPMRWSRWVRRSYLSPHAGKRVHIFLADSSGFKGFWKPSSLKRKPFLGVNLFRKLCVGPATSLATGELQPQIGNANSVLDQMVYPGVGFEGRITSVSIGFCFVEKERCKANMKLVQRRPCCFRCHGSAEELWKWSVFIPSHLSAVLCFCLCFPAGHEGSFSLC